MADIPQFDYDVFLSHNRADKDWVHQLAARIERETWNGRALKVFFDEWDIQPGDNIPITLEKALPKSRKIALVMSPDFFKSEWTETERAGATILSPANRAKRTIPLYLRECEIPLLLSELKYIDFRDAKNFDAAYRQLLAFLREEPLPRGDPSTPPLRGSAQDDKHSAPIPRPPQYGFVARYDDDGNDLVERVSELLNQNRAVALVGSGGLGKTTLAAEIVRRLTSPPTPPLAGEGRRGEVVWASADGRADFSFGTLLDEVATQLGEEKLRTLALEQKSIAVRGLLVERQGDHKGSPVLVIDNFETIAAEQQKAIADFVNTLSCAVLVTSRVAVEGAERVNIGAMTPDEAREFLRRQIASSPKKNALTPLIDEIANLAERNPMVMRWIVGQLERAQRMSDVLDELSRGQGDAATRVFGRSFGLLNPDTQATLLSLVLFVPSANRTALAFTTGFGNDIKRLNDALKPLADLQLLETDANNERLSVVGLTRRFTKAQLNKDANAAEYRKRFVDYFVNYAEAHRKTTPEDLNALEAERENLLAAMDIAFAVEDWQSVMRVMDCIFEGLLYTHGYWDEAIARGRQAAEAARHAGNEWNIALYQSHAAAIRKNRGEYEKAKETYEQVLDVFKKLKSDKNVAANLHQLGNIAYEQGDYEIARQRYAESLEIEKKLGNRSGIAKSLHQLGMIADQQGDYETARQRYAESLDIAKKQGDQLQISKSLHELGMIAQQQGDHEMAQQRYAESLEIKKKLGDQSGIAITLHQLGNIAYQKGDYGTAQQRYTESLGIAKKLGNQSGIAITLHQLGMIAQQQGDYENARARYAESLEIEKKLGNQSGIASTLHQLGRLAEIEGNKAKAARLFREALEIFERLRSPNAKIARESLERVTQEAESGKQ